jgi:hypothetical protein
MRPGRFRSDSEQSGTGNADPDGKGRESTSALGGTDLSSGPAGSNDRNPEIWEEFSTGDHRAECFNSELIQTLGGLEYDADGKEELRGSSGQTPSDTGLVGPFHYSLPLSLHGSNPAGNRRSTSLRQIALRVDHTHNPTSGFP